MAYEDENWTEAETKNNAQRNNISRKGLAGSRPQRRVVDGHTKPCVECGVLDWQSDNSRGEISCGGCGLVVEENVIDPGIDWTNHDNATDRSRIGAPTTHTLADKGLNTSIAISDLTSGAASRHGMSARARRDWRRRRVMDERSKTRASRARNLVKANQMVRDKSGLPKSMQEEVCRLYKILSHQGFVTGRSIAGVTAACTYLVARREGVPRQIPEICETFQVDEKELSRMIRHISRKFNMHKISSPSDYFGRFLSDLKLPPRISMQVEHLWSTLKPHVDLWQGKKPMGVAAALIYKAAAESGHKRTQADICKVANVSEVTLRQLNRVIETLFKRLGEADQN